MKNLVSKEALETAYVKEELTIKECAKLFNMSVGAVFNYLNRYGIPTRKIITEKTRRKLSESLKGHPPRTSYIVSEETRRKISEANRGRVYKPSKYGGHTKKRKDGYVYVYLPEHPYSSKDGYVMEHILVMEAHIGHYITRDYVVHHKNHIRDDNRIENLQLMTFREHAGFHMRERHKLKKEKKEYEQMVRSRQAC